MSGVVPVAAADRGAARAAWLRAHGEGLPGAFGDITPEERAALDVRATEMRRLGLYCVAYDQKLVRWSMRLILGTIRGERTPTYRERVGQRYRS